MAVFDDELDPRAIGERLRHHRARAGLTRAQLGGLVGRSPSWVARAERGEIRLDRLSILQKLGRALGVPLGELVGVGAWGGTHRRRTAVSAIRARGEATVRVCGAHLDAGRRRTVAAVAAVRRTSGPLVVGAGAAVAVHLRRVRVSARRGLALALMGLTLAMAWVIAHLAKLPSTATTHHRRSAFLTVSAVLVSSGLVATVAIGLGGVSFTGSPYAQKPFTTPSPASNVKPAPKTSAKPVPNPVASVPLAHLPAATPAPAPATPAVTPTSAAPEPAAPRVAPVPAPAAALTSAVTGAVKPVSQTLGQTVGAVTGAVKPVTQTLGTVVHAAQPVTHVVTSLGSLLGQPNGGLSGLSAVRHQQPALGFGTPLRALIGSWVRAFDGPMGGGWMASPVLENPRAQGLVP